jgi:predicted component of type VI protein secretion system
MQPEVVLTVNEGDNPSRQVAIKSRRFTIGRSPDNDLSINEPSLSRRHTLIEIFDGIVQVSDCGSQNGTFVNGRLVTGAIVVNDGDTVSIGSGCDVTVRLKNPSPAIGSIIIPNHSSLAAEVGDQAVSPESSAIISYDPRSRPEQLGSLKIATIAVGAILVILAPVLIVLNSNAQKPKAAPPALGQRDSTGEAKSDAGPAPRAEAKSPGKSPDEISIQQIEIAASQVMRRISTDTKVYVFPSDALNDIKARIEQYRKSPVLLQLLRAMGAHSAEIAKQARREGMEPGLVVYLALTEAVLGQETRDPVAAARKAMPTLLDIWKVVGSTLADGSLLIIAAYKIGPVTTVGHTSRKSHPLLAAMRGSDVERNVWSLHKRGKLGQETYDFVVSFLSIGAISQTPSQFRVEADPLTF